MQNTKNRTKNNKELKVEMITVLDQKVEAIIRESVRPILNEHIAEKSADLMSQLSNLNTGDDKVHEMVFNKIHDRLIKETIKQLRESKN